MTLTTLILTSFLLATLTPVALPHSPPIATYYAAPQYGRVMHYSAGIFSQVAHNQGIPMRWGEVDGFASTQDCATGYAPQHPDIRVHPWVVYASIDHTYPRAFEILDCSNPRDVAYHRAIGLILEVDYATATSLSRNGYPRLLADGHSSVRILGYARLP